MMERNQRPLSFEELVRNAQAERAVVVGELIARGVNAVMRALSSIGNSIRTWYGIDNRNSQRRTRAAIESWAGRY